MPNILSQLERDLGLIFGGGRARPQRRAPAKAKHVAIFPCGTEVEIVRHTGKYPYFSLTTPSGECIESSLRDVKWFAEKGNPGIRFERR